MDKLLASLGGEFKGLADDIMPMLQGGKGSEEDQTH